MIPYTKYSYLFPPRPTQTTKYTELYKYDNGDYIAQPKYNGTCCVVFISEDELIVMNRHKSEITSNYSQVDLKGMHRGKGWMVICGEFLNKNQNGEDGKPFNLKFIIWDILVYQNEYLIGKKAICTHVEHPKEVECICTAVMCLNDYSGVKPLFSRNGRGVHA
jgi:hypothetical protein